MNWTLSPELLNLLLVGLQATQLGVRAVLHGVGLAPDLHGQPAWPFEGRVAGEMLLMDASHARRVVITLLCLASAAVLLGVSLMWRRARHRLWLGTGALLLLAPWPHEGMLFMPAVPTSLHVSPSGFTSQGIVRGQATYAVHCVRCHGTDGRGEGPDASHLPMWPPTLNGSLLWKRLEGELFWRVREGMRNRQGQVTMPGFGSQLTDTQVWELLDFLQAQAAGQMLKATGIWSYPVRLPDGPVTCRQSRRATARSLVGQRLRVVLQGSLDAWSADDPRWVTLQVPVRARRVGTALPSTDAECQTTDATSGVALSLVLGVSESALSGYQIMVDRPGWLRAVAKPGQAAWSEDDLVCRSGADAVQSRKTAPVTTAAAANGLDVLIRRMDAEPVSRLRGGFPH